MAAYRADPQVKANLEAHLRVLAAALCITVPELKARTT